MRFLRFSLPIFVFFFSGLVCSQRIEAQQTKPSATVTSSPPVISPAPKDPQAISILNQALASTGGASAVAAIADYKASGSVTYHWNKDVAGTVTVSGRGLDQLRIDANLPTGVRSSVISAGQSTTKAEDGTVLQAVQKGPIPTSDAFVHYTPMFPSSLAFPYRQLTSVLKSKRFKLSYQGLVQVDGRPAHDIRIERLVPGETASDSRPIRYNTVDLLIDSLNFQILMLQDRVPKNTIHQIRYSDFRPTNGVLIPFMISERMGGQATWEIHLDQANVNVGLTDVTFTLQ